MVGPTGPVVTDQIILGLVLFAPACTYPAHSHDGISESYICLSGSVSENDQGVYAPGSLIFNPPEHLHRITVADTQPALLLYAWHGTPEKLRNQRMVFTRRTGYAPNEVKGLAERKSFGSQLYRFATRRWYLSRPNTVSIRLPSLKGRLSPGTLALR